MIVIEEIMDEKIEKLKLLYQKSSKHSNYQVLPSQLQKVLLLKDLEIHSRYEKERFDYMKKKINIEGKVFCDIGCNVGYFSFAMIETGAKKGYLYEGNKVHADFVKTASEVLGLKDRLEIYDHYYTFEEDGAYDIVLLLNVLHHVGDDYGRAENVDDAKKIILSQLNIMAKITNILIFQIGFNWMGNINKSLFKDGTKEEMIQWLEDGTKGVWKIKEIGAAKLRNRKVTYEDVNSKNIKRKDELGEFLNRPLFVLERI